MGNYITIGEYNKLYKYIWICILLKSIFEYLYGNDFIEDMKYFKSYTYPKSVLIQEGLNYLGIFILSIFLFFYEKSQNKNEQSESLVNNHINKKSHNPSLIYLDIENIETSFKCIFMVIILIIVCYRMCEIFFVCYITLKMFKIPIYRHKKLAIGFILIFCSSMKNFSTYYRIIDNHKKRVFKVYAWIIPIGILFFIVLSFFRAYMFCKIKWLLDLKFISVSKLLILYGFFGSLICLIISIIPTYIPCIKNKNTFKNIKYFCNVTDFEYFFLFLLNYFLF